MLGLESEEELCFVLFEIYWLAFGCPGEVWRLVIDPLVAVITALIFGNEERFLITYCHSLLESGVPVPVRRDHLVRQPKEVVVWYFGKHLVFVYAEVEEVVGRVENVLWGWSP